MIKFSLIFMLIISMFTSHAALQFSGKELSFQDINSFFRKELKKIKPQAYNFFVKLDPKRKKALNKKTFSVDFTGLSIRQALDSFAKSSNLSVSIEGRVVVLSDSSKMITKSYYVLTEFNDMLKKNKKGKALPRSTVKFLKSIGVKFPKGSAANYNLTRNVVLMTNTPANHKQARESLRGIGLLYK